jgi:tRNA(Ile)-lysidine synthase
MPQRAALALDADEFAALLDRLGPFEARPHVAIAVSGGRDSLALAVLADAWARTRHGRVTALIVDHGLRRESGEEARSVAAQLAGLNIDAEILPWPGNKPATGVAEAARAARYRLLQDWCLRRSVLHLLLAHQRDDQAETFLMRLADGSGADGLAATASVSELSSVRVVRPLLDVSRVRLTATLQARGLAWVDDPTNSNLRYLRPRLRQNLSSALLQDAGDLAGRFAADRAAVERRLAVIMAECVAVRPEGWLVIDGGYFGRLPCELAARVLARAVFVIGGGYYRPRQDAIRGAMAMIAAAKPATAGGCRIVPRGAEILLAREAGAIVQTIDFGSGRSGGLRWDNRFDLELDGLARGRIEALGEHGRLAVLHEHRFAGPAHDFVTSLPAMVSRALPALWAVLEDGQTGGLLAVWGGGRASSGPATVPALGCERLVAVFRPERPLAPAPHALVLAGQRLI